MVDPEYRVLVVEDDRSIRELLCCMLAEEGYAMRMASTGREAFAVMELWRPDLILLDLLMPNMDGWSFRDEQRRSQAADIPVLVLTAVSYPEIHEDTLAAPVVLKPFELDDLLGAIQQLLPPAHPGPLSSPDGADIGYPGSDSPFLSDQEDQFPPTAW